MRHVPSFLQKLKIVVKGKAENQEDQIKRRRESCNPLRKDNKTEACCHYSQQSPTNGIQDNRKGGFLGSLGSDT